MVSLFFAAVNPPSALAVPSFARQTGLPCSGCHYNPPELNPAGRRFKLLGYVDRADETKTIHADSGKSHAALDLLASLLFAPGAVSGFAKGSPRSAGYIATVSYWAWQNLQLAAQYTGYTRFNGGATDYDGSGRNASANNTVYLDAKFVF